MSTEQFKSLVDLYKHLLHLQMREKLERLQNVAKLCCPCFLGTSLS